MKYELPCEIVKDLLPSYIDELAGASTGESVKAHLEGCTECRKIYENMKNDVENPKPAEENGGENNEKNLYKKVKRQIHKKVWIAIGAGLAAVLLAIGIEHLLYEAIIKDVPLEDVHISTTVYAMEEYKQLDSKDDRILTVMADTGEYVDDLGYRVENIDEVEYVTTFEISSPYILKNVRFWNIAGTPHNGTLQMDRVKTSVLNNRLPDGEYRFSYTCFGKVDKIVYLEVDEDEEIVLWESGQ